jgi:hypothetical protein
MSSPTEPKGIKITTDVYLYRDGTLWVTLPEEFGGGNMAVRAKNEPKALKQIAAAFERREGGAS